MTVQLSYQHDTPVRFGDPLGLIPTSCVLTLRSAGGTALQTPTVTIASTSTTVASGTLADRVKLASATGIAVGDLLVITDEGVDVVFEVVKLDGVYAYLLANFPEVPTTGATVKLVKMTATITALGATYIGRGLSLTWDYTSATTRREHRESVECVRSPWAGTVTPAHVAATLGAAYFQQGISWGYCTRLARLANEEIESRLLETGRRAALYFSGDAFTTAIEPCVRYQLALDGYHGGNDPQVRGQAWAAMNAAIGRIVSSLKPYDSLDSGTPDARPAIGTVQLVR